MQKQKKPFSLMAFIRPHRAGFITSTVLAVLSVASGMVPYFAVAKMVNLLISGEKTFSVYLTWGAAALIAYLLKSILHGISTRCSHEATFHVLSELRRAVADKLTRVSMGYLTDTPSGRLKTTMVERVEQMEVPLAHIIPEMTSNLLVPIAIVVYLFLLDWRMALVSLITIPIGMFCYMAQMKEYPKKYGTVVQAGKHMSATTVEYINGIEVIKAFNQSAASYGKFTQAVRQSADLMLDWMKSTQGYSALMMTIWPAVLIGVLPIGCVFYRNGSLTAPDFITIAILSLGIVGPLVAAIFLTDDFSKIATITGEIGAVLSEPDLERPAQRKELHGLDIDLRDVTFAYKDKQVLNGVTLNIRHGTTTALVGPSGSGKTTCLRLIAGFEQLSGGAISIFGKPASNLPPWERDVNTVFQDYALFPHMSILDNVAYGLMVKGVNKKQRHAMAQEALEKVALGFVHQRKPSQLSGGQRQRVAIARALVNEPRVLLLDEPLGALDLKLREQMQLELKKLQQSLGITFIFVTHDQGEALSMSDRVAVFNNGRIEQVDSPRDLYMRPRTPFVAGFVGTSNVFDGLMAEKLCGMTGSFALRPEHIRLNTPGELQANGTIQAVQYQGAATRFELKLNGGEKLLVSQANMTGEELPATLTPGQQVMVSWSRDVMVPLVEER